MAEEGRHELGVDFSVDADCTFEAIVLDGCRTQIRTRRKSAEAHEVNRYAGRLTSGVNWLFLRAFVPESELTAVARIDNAGQRDWKAIGPLGLRLEPFDYQRVHIDHDAVPPEQRKGALALAFLPHVFDDPGAWPLMPDALVQSEAEAGGPAATLMCAFQVERVVVYYPAVERMWTQRVSPESGRANDVYLRGGLGMGRIQGRIADEWPAAMGAPMHIRLLDNWATNFKDGQLLRGVSRVVVEEGGEIDYSVGVEAGGTFEIGDLPAGPYRISLATAKRTLRTKTVVVDSDSTLEVELRPRSP